MIFPLNRSFDFTKFGIDTEPKGRNTNTELTGYCIGLILLVFGCFQFLTTKQIREKKIKRKKKERKEKKKSLFLFTFPHFLSTQTPSKPKKNLNHVYNQKTYQNKKIYIFPLLSHVFSPKHRAPSTKQVAKKKKKNKNKKEQKRSTEAT